MTGSTHVYLEVGTKRVFACALDWPGWCRSGRDEQSALDALAAYLPRYAAVVKEAGLSNPETDFDVVERLPGNGSTEFGVPGAIPERDHREPLNPLEAKRMGALVNASWKVFDRVVAGAPAELRKGPRGGGRDRDKIVAHVLGAEVGYARMVGVRHAEPNPADSAEVAAQRAELVEALVNRSVRERGWPPRYAARRIAWHVLDHAWEIEDRSD
jgi:hypothetical protein